VSLWIVGGGMALGLLLGWGIGTWITRRYRRKTDELFRLANERFERETKVVWADMKIKREAEHGEE